MPSICVTSVRQLFNDGNHNAFTDLCRFRNRLFLTFRSCPDGHMLFTSSRIVVLSSSDGTDWEQVHAFSVANRDVRDPHFLVFDDKLFVYSGAWWVNPDDADEQDVNDHLGFCVWSEDGDSWHGPRMLEGTHGHYIWRAAARDGMAYLNGRRIRNFDVIPRRAEPSEYMESWLLHSGDGFNWVPLSRIQAAHGDETALLFEDNGDLLAVARASHFGGGPVHPTLNANTFALGGWQWGPDWAKWLDTDGEQGAEPPEDVKRLRVLRDQILGEADEDARNALIQEVFEIHMDNIWSIGLVVDDPKFGQLTNVHNRLRNVVT